MKQCRSWWILDSPALLYFLLGYYYYSLPGQDFHVAQIPLRRNGMFQSWDLGTPPCNPCTLTAKGPGRTDLVYKPLSSPTSPFVLWTCGWLIDFEHSIYHFLRCKHLLQLVLSCVSIFRFQCWDHPPKNPWGNAQQGSAAAAEAHPEPWPELVAATSRYPHCCIKCSKPNNEPTILGWLTSQP